MDAEARLRIIERLRTMYPVGSSIEKFAVTDFRVETDQVVLIGRHAQDPHLFGIPLNWEKTPHGFFYTDDWVLSADEWIDSVDIGLMVALSTSLIVGARRRQVNDYIELVEDDDRPTSPFYVQRLNENPTRFAYLGHLGWDLSVGQQHRRDGTLLAWVDCYWNTTPSKTACQVVIGKGSAPSVGDVVLIDALPGTPVTATVDAVLLAAQLAASEGVSTITTTDITPELDILGFRANENGHRALDTAFLDFDMAAYRKLIESEVAAGKWNPKDFVRRRTQHRFPLFTNLFSGVLRHGIKRGWRRAAVPDQSNP